MEKFVSRAVPVCLALLGFAAAVFYGCIFDSNGNCAGPCSSGAPFWLRPDFSDAEQLVVVDQRSYAMRSFVWRDFMPYAPCMKLTAVVEFSALDSLPLPSNLFMDYVWIRHGEDSWNVEFTDERPSSYQAFKTSRVARCGPKWPTGDLVDVGIRIRFGESPEIYLQEKNVPIERTE